jgi:hypothetical protein
VVALATSSSSPRGDLELPPSSFATWGPQLSPLLHGSLAPSLLLRDPAAAALGGVDAGLGLARLAKKAVLSGPAQHGKWPNKPCLGRWPGMVDWGGMARWHDEPCRAVLGGTFAHL